MARIIRHNITRTLDGRKVRSKSRKRYVEYRDGPGVRQRVPGFTDKQATQQLASELERKAALEQAGLVDHYAAHHKRPLTEHLGD